MKSVDSKSNPGLSKLPTEVRNKMGYMKKGGLAMKHDDAKMDKKTVKKAVGMHDKQMHGGKKTDMTKLKKGGMTKMAMGGMAYASGGKVAKCAEGGAMHKMPDGSMMAGKTHAMKKGGKVMKCAEGGAVKPKKMACGGATKKMAKGGGIESRGKTRGKMC